MGVSGMDGTGLSIRDYAGSVGSSGPCRFFAGPLVASAGRGGSWGASLGAEGLSGVAGCLGISQPGRHGLVQGLLFDGEERHPAGWRAR
jgi:hypothetical protein